MDEKMKAALTADCCKWLDCAPEDLCDFEVQKTGLTNTSIKFRCGDTTYIYRYPGKQTSRFLSRKAEAISEELARELGLDDTLVAIDAETGSKLCICIEKYDYIDPYDIEGDQKVAMEMIRKLHDAKGFCEWNMDYGVNTDVYIDILKENGCDFSPYEAQHAEMLKLNKVMEGEGFEKVLCHNDVWFWNYLKDDSGKIHLIDWEYAGMNWPQADVADYTISLDFTDEQYMALAESYEGHELSAKERRFYFGALALCLWYWFVWGLYTEWSGTEVEDLQMWLEKATHNLEISKKLYEL